MTRTIYCQKLEKNAEGLDAAPFPGEIGQKIADTISKEAWSQWLAHQTMLINEYRLSLLEPEAQSFLLKEMEKFLWGGGAEKPPGFTDNQADQ